MSRDQYLQALGIERWALRSRRGAAAMPADALPAASTAVVAVAADAAAGADAVGSAVGGASAAADSAAWDELRTEVSGCRLCGLCATRTQTVFGVGDRHAEVLVVGEAPGADEDRQGEPFVGRAGQLLNSMLRAFGRPRETVYIANVLKCRPPGNRDPNPTEVASCLPYLQRQIELLGPRLILVVGRIAAQTLLATDTPIGRLRGHMHRFGARGTPLIVTYHPAYLLRSPGEKRRAWADLKAARATLARLRAEAAGAEAAG
jgi:uracil-DNA glycosylase